MPSLGPRASGPRSTPRRHREGDDEKEIDLIDWEYGRDSKRESGSTATTQNSSPPRPRTGQTDQSDSNQLLEDVLGGPLRHLATTPKGGSDAGHHPMTIRDQRHPGKKDAKIHRSTRVINPETLEMREKNGPGGGRPYTADEVSEENFVTGWPLLCLVVGLMCAVFLISIDRTIISTVSDKT